MSVSSCSSRSSKAARRSGVSIAAAHSRCHSMSIRAAPRQDRRERAAPSVRTRSSGSEPVGEEGEAEGCPSRKTGSMRSMARAAAASPARSPSKQRSARARAATAVHLPLGEGGAERRHGCAGSPPDWRDHVHIAFDHHQLVLVERGLAGAGEVEHDRAFVEELGLGRIQIFRLGRGIERAGAEGDDADLALWMGMVSRCAKAIVGRAAVVGLDSEARVERAALRSIRV